MTGIDITPSVGAAIAGQVAVKIVKGTTQQTSVGPQDASKTPWRPPQWNQPATYMLTVQGTEGLASNTPQEVQSSSPDQPLQVKTIATTHYVFDAVIRAHHNQSLQITEHPIQVGANISDHAYLMPFRLSLEIGVSDAMDAYAAGMWSGSQSKSVAAYQTLLALQAARVFITVSTRLKTYTNMMIESISPEEDLRTVASLRATITFKQVFTVAVALQEVSARPNSTDQTQLATVQPQPVPAPVANQYAVTPPANPTVAGSGLWSSVASMFQGALGVAGAGGR